MSDLSSQTQALDLRLVDDPGVRQALRSMYQQMLDKIAHQQLAIDAMLEMLIEKNFTSVGELKRQFARLQQNAQRGERLHQALSAAATIPNPTPAAPAPGMHAPARP